MTDAMMLPGSNFWTGRGASCVDHRVKGRDEVDQSSEVFALWAD